MRGCVACVRLCKRHSSRKRIHGSPVWEGGRTGRVGNPRGPTPPGGGPGSTLTASGDRGVGPTQRLTPVADSLCLQRFAPAIAKRKKAIAGGREPHRDFGPRTRTTRLSAGGGGVIITTLQDAAKIAALCFSPLSARHVAITDKGRVLPFLLPAFPGRRARGPATPRGRDSPGLWPARGLPAVGTHLGLRMMPRYDIYYETPGIPDLPLSRVLRIGRGGSGARVRCFPACKSDKRAHRVPSNGERAKALKVLSRL